MLRRNAARRLNPVGSEEMPAYFARPAGNTKAPVIIVAMEVFGLHEYRT